MRAPYTELFVHLVWATWDRLPILTPEVESSVYAAIADKCRDMNCEPLALGGVADHVHVLVRLNPAIAVADLVKEVKGSSSHLVTHRVQPGEFFKWQGAYRAFSLRKSEVEHVRAYIQNQPAHHGMKEIDSSWELPDEEPTHG